MNNSNYNSLFQTLTQDSLVFEEEKQKQDPVSIPVENKKRINCYEIEPIETNFEDTINFKTVAVLSFLNKFLNSKVENLFFKLFPKLYKAHLVKIAMEKLSELDIDVKNLLDKTIPYGESQMRYEDLIKYLKYASEIQVNLKSEYSKKPKN